MSRPGLLNLILKLLVSDSIQLHLFIKSKRSHSIASPQINDRTEDIPVLSDLRAFHSVVSYFDHRCEQPVYQRFSELLRFLFANITDSLGQIVARQITATVTSSPLPTREAFSSSSANPAETASMPCLRIACKRSPPTCSKPAVVSNALE